MGSQFSVGQWAIPKEKTGHDSFEDFVGKKFKIIKIHRCPHSLNASGDRDRACKTCPGDPIVILNGKQRGLCGYGAPSANFFFESADWDT